MGGNADARKEGEGGGEALPAALHLVAMRGATHYRMEVSPRRVAFAESFRHDEAVSASWPPVDSRGPTRSTCGTGTVLAVGLGVPLVGYLLMAVDVRRYLRSLRRAGLVQHVVPTTPIGRIATSLPAWRPWDWSFRALRRMSWRPIAAR